MPLTVHDVTTTRHVAERGIKWLGFGSLVSTVYRVCGSVMLVCLGRRVITTWRLSWEQVCTVLVWVALGAWPGGEEGSCVAA